MNWTRHQRILFRFGGMLILLSLWGIFEIQRYYQENKLDFSNSFYMGSGYFIPKLLLIPCVLIFISVIAFLTGDIIKLSRLTILLAVLLILLSYVGYEGYSKYSGALETAEAAKKSEQQLKNDVNRLNSSIKSLNNEVNKYKNLSSETQAKLNKYIQLEQEYKNTVPDNYYFNNTADGTSEELVTFLNKTFDMPVDYKLNVFDCSEKAAFMERQLENAGFMTYIAVGDSPTNPGTGHAWIIVMTSDNYKVAIEPTAIVGGMDGATQRLFSSFSNKGLGIVYSNQNELYYSGYDQLFKDIYEAQDFLGLQEFDWWLGMWDLK